MYFIVIQVLKTFDTKQMECSIESVKKLKSSFRKLLKEIDGIKIFETVDGNTHPGGFLFKLLEKAKVSYRQPFKHIRIK